MLKERIEARETPLIELTEALHTKESGKPYTPQLWEKWTRPPGDKIIEKGDRLKFIVNWSPEIRDEHVDIMFALLSGTYYRKATNIGGVYEAIVPELVDDEGNPVSVTIEDYEHGVEMGVFFLLMILGYENPVVNATIYGIEMSKEVVYGSVAVVGIGAVVGSKAAGWW